MSLIIGHILIPFNLLLCLIIYFILNCKNKINNYGINIK